MKESAFLLGRFLRVADEIHRMYCEVVRKKELPPELCGSSILVSMMESPGLALDQLAMRSAPYVKWAGSYRYQQEEKKNESEKKNIRAVRFWWRHWSEVTDQLYAKQWPKRLRPEERAQVFLGFLSSFPKREKLNASNDSTESTNNQGE